MVFFPEETPGSSRLKVKRMFQGLTGLNLRYVAREKDTSKKDQEGGLLKSVKCAERPGRHTHFEHRAFKQRRNEHGTSTDWVTEPFGHTVVT